MFTLLENSANIFLNGIVANDIFNPLPQKTQQIFTIWNN